MTTTGILARSARKGGTGESTHEGSLDPRFPSLHRLRAVDYLLVGATVTALLVLTLALGHLTDFYSVDQDIKYLAALNIAHHFGNPAISYPFQAFDPTGRFTLPLTAWYNGHEYAGYSLPFEYLSGAAIWLWGIQGIVVPPILATAVILVMQLKVSGALGLTRQRALVALATLAATPVLFYTVSFWEHTWAVALFLAGLVLLLVSSRIESENRRSGDSRAFLASLNAEERTHARNPQAEGGHDSNVGRLSSWSAWLPPFFAPRATLASLGQEPRSFLFAVSAGLLYAASVLMRRELIVPCILSLAIIPLVSARREDLVRCALAGVAFCIPIGLILLAHPEPLALGLTHASPGRKAIGVQSGVTYLEKIQWLASGGYATGLFLLVSGVLIWSRRFRPDWLPGLFAAGSVAVGVALVLSMVSNYSFSFDNPLAFCPLAIWGVWSILLWNKLSRMAVSLWILAALGSIAVVLLAYDYGGAQWGPRYLLFSFPLWILLAVLARQILIQGATRVLQRRLVAHSFASLLAVSVMMQLLGLFSLTVKQNLTAENIDQVAAVHVPVVASLSADIDWLAPAYERGLYLYAQDSGDLRRIASKLAAIGHTRFVMVCGPREPWCRWPKYAGWTHSRVQYVRHGLRFTVYRRI